MALESAKQWNAITLLHRRKGIFKAFCDQCKMKTEEGYLCDACDGDGYVLCFNCMARLGREAHAHRRGFAHSFTVYRFRMGCNVCRRMYRWNEPPFLQCSQDPACKFDICGDCTNEHSNITNHTAQKGPEHTFKLINPHREAPPIRQSEPYVPVQGKGVVCSGCTSQIHTEFFRCLNCTIPFDLCARCVDEGAVAKHVFHNFTYLVVSSNHGDFGHRNIPESNR